MASIPKIEKCEYLSQFPTDFFGLSGDPHSFYEYYSAPEDERLISHGSEKRANAWKKTNRSAFLNRGKSASRPLGLSSTY